MSIELTSEECEVLRRWGKDPDRIAAACHQRPNWLRDLLAMDEQMLADAPVVSQRIPTGEEMSGVSDLSKEELGVIAEAIELWEKLMEVLGRVEARPRDYRLHIETEVEPGYLGWIGYNEGGSVTFQPAAPDA